MRHALLMCLVLLFAGCAADWGYEADPNEEAEYREVYQAMYQVLSNHFRVETSRRTSRDMDMIATSKITTDGISQYRIKVTARVVWDEDDILRPEIRVLNQVDMGISDASARSSAQQNHAWRAAGFNHDMEAQLLNEVHEVLNGGKSFESKMFMNPLKKGSSE